jgi:hypothetical protein
MAATMDFVMVATMADDWVYQKAEKTAAERAETMADKTAST